MRRALAICVAALVVAGGALATAADPSPKAISDLGARLTKLKKQVTKVAARRGPPGRAGAEGAAGAKGPAGERGPVGDGEPGIPASSAFVSSGALGTSSVPIVAIAQNDSLNRGFVIRANAVFTNTAAQPATVVCGLRVAFLGNVFDTATAILGPSGSSDTRTLRLVSPFSAGAFFAFTEQFQCAATGVPAGSVTFSDADIMVIEVDRVLGNVNRS
jgi:hypothetical protein